MSSSEATVNQLKSAGRWFPTVLTQNPEPSAEPAGKWCRMLFAQRKCYCCCCVCFSFLPTAVASNAGAEQKQRSRWHVDSTACPISDVLFHFSGCQLCIFAPLINEPPNRSLENSLLTLCLHHPTFLLIMMPCQHIFLFFFFLISELLVIFNYGQRFFFSSSWGGISVKHHAKSPRTLLAASPAHHLLRCHPVILYLLNQGAVDALERRGSILCCTPQPPPPAHPPIRLLGFAHSLLECQAITASIFVTSL